MKNITDFILESMSFDDKIEKWWDKKRVLWHVEQLRKIEEKYKE